MTKRASSKSGRGAVATGATATGAASLAAMALGAMALGAVAVGALAVGRLTVGRARLRRVEIGELTVGRFEIGADDAVGRLTATARVRSAPGKGDALERFLRDRAAESQPDGLLHRARRSRIDPDAFLFCASYADEAAFDRHAEAPRLEALLQQAAAEGLVAASGDDPLELELYRAI